MHHPIAFLPRLAFVLFSSAFLLLPFPHASAQQLEYRYRETFRNADGYLLQVEGNLEMVAKQVAAATAADAPQAQANIDGLSKRLAFAHDHIAKLPKEHPDVQALITRAASAEAEISKLQSALNARVSGTQSAVDSKTAQLAADVEKLKEWGAAFADPANLFHRKPDDALLLVSSLAEVDAEWSAIQSRWPALLNSSNHDRDAQSLQNAAAFFNRSVPTFKQHVEQLKTHLPAEIDSIITQAENWLQRAQDDQNPLLITNGAGQQLQALDRAVKLLAGIDASAAKPALAKQLALRAKAQTAQVALRESIIQSKTLPAADYAGPDVADLRERIKAHWLKLHPDTPPLAIVFNTPGWSRVTRWQWSRGNKAWEKVDYDHLQPKLIIRHDDRLALIIPVDLYKDHLQSDRLTITPWDLPADPDIHSLLLLDRVQP